MQAAYLPSVAVGINVRTDAQDGNFAAQQWGEAGESMDGWWTDKKELRPGRSSQGHGDFRSPDSNLLINLISPDRGFEHTSMHKMRGHIHRDPLAWKVSPLQTARKAFGRGHARLQRNLRSATVSRRLPRMTDLPNPSRRTLGHTCSRAHELLIWAVRSEEDLLLERSLQALENLMACMCFLAAATHNPTVLRNPQTSVIGLPFHEYLTPLPT